MMRRARIPHAACGSSAGLQPSSGGLRLGACARSAGDARRRSHPRRAARPAPRTRAVDRRRRPRKSSFPKKPGGILGPTPKIDQAQPLYLQADQLLYDTKSNRVIAQGNVEIYYNNYILTADQVVYDQSTNKLIAEGNAQLKDPNGSITRADRFEALDDFRDAFIQSLSVVTADDTRIAAERASRREGNTTEYERAQVHAVQERPRHAAAVVHQRRPHHPRSARRHHHLPGCAVRVLRRAGGVPALLRASRPLGEAPLRLPDAELRQFHRRSVSASRCPTISPWRRTTISPSIPSIGPTTASCGRATGVTGWPTASTPFPSPPSTRVAMARRWRQWRRRGWRGSVADQGPILALVVVAVRMGRHGRQRRQLPPLLPARSDPADRPRQHRLSAGHERPQLLQRQALSVRRPAAHRHALLQFLGASRSSTTTTSSAHRCSAAS